MSAFINSLAGQEASSLLSALALFTFASALHITTSEHAAVVSLKEPRSLVQSVHLLLVLFLLLVHDLLERFSLSLFFASLCPLIPDLGQVVFLFVKISLGVVPLLILFAHLSVVRVKGVRVRLVGIFEVAHECLLCILVCLFDLSKLLSQFVQLSLQIFHALLVRCLGLVFLFHSLTLQLVLGGILFSFQLVFGLLEVFYFKPTVFFMLLALLGKLLELFFLCLKLVSELLDTLVRQLNLLLHARVVLERRSQLGEPEANHLLEDCVELVDFTVLRLYITEVLVQLGLHVVSAEDADKLEDVGADGVGVSNGFVALQNVFKRVYFPVQGFHVHRVHAAILALEVHLANGFLQ